MRRILSFVTIFLSGLHSFPVEPDDQLNLFSLDADPMAESANANLDLTYQPSEADDIFSSVGSDEFLFNDLINPILLSDEASSTVSQWMGEPMDSINVARSLDSLQPFDIAAKQEGFCLKDGEQKSPPIKLNLPTSLDDLDILVNPKPLGVWICPGSAQILLCCKPSQSQYVTRARCKRFSLWDPDCETADEVACCLNLEADGTGTECAPAWFRPVPPGWPTKK